MPKADVEISDDAASLARTRWATFVTEAAPSYDPAKQLAELERDGVYDAVLIARIAVFDLEHSPR